MCELKKIGKVNLLGPDPRLIKKIYRAAVSQRLRNTRLDCIVLAAAFERTRLRI